MTPGDAVAVAAKATNVDLHALPRDDAAVFDVEFTVDVDGTALVGDQQRQQRVGEVWVPARVVLAALALAGSAEMVTCVVVSDGESAGAAEMLA